jgi:hypothetical protein
MLAKSQVHPQASKAYYDIYSPGEVINEKAGTPEHRDIAVDTGIKGPIHTNPVSIDFAALPVPGVNETKLIGQVSHPLTLVSFRQNDREIAKTIADTYGFYEVQISNKTLTPGVKIIPYFKKVNLATQVNNKAPKKNFFESMISYVKAIFEKKTSAAPEAAVGASIDSIPRYLEGYVYDTNNNPLANKNVEVKLVMSDKTVTEFTTDNRGFIQITPSYLPIFPYYLLVDGKVKISTDQFIQANETYLNTNQINVLTATKQGKEIE